MTASTGDDQDVDTQEFWGYLIKPDKCGTELFNRLLTGISSYITANIEPNNCADISTSQLAEFYRQVGGDYDVLFKDTPPQSISFIYRSLGCLHSLQPAPGDDGHAAPSVPSLKPKGYITWQTIQLLLDPEEHAQFIQNAVSRFDVIDPKTGKAFPKPLPIEALPQEPDKDMVEWYETVSERLRREAEEEEEERQAREEREHRRFEGTTDRPSLPDHRRDVSSDTHRVSGEYLRPTTSYFSHQPSHRESQPTIIRRYTRTSNAQPGPRSPRQRLQERSRLVANTVRHFWGPRQRSHERPSPQRFRRASLPDDYILSTDSESSRSTSPDPRWSHREPLSPEPSPAASHFRAPAGRQYYSTTATAAPQPVPHGSSATARTSRRPRPPTREPTPATFASDSDTTSPPLSSQPRPYDLPLRSSLDDSDYFRQTLRPRHVEYARRSSETASPRTFTVPTAFGPPPPPQQQQQQQQQPAQHHHHHHPMPSPRLAATAAASAPAPAGLSSSSSSSSAQQQRFIPSKAPLFATQVAQHQMQPPSRTTTANRLSQSSLPGSKRGSGVFYPSPTSASAVPPVLVASGVAGGGVGGGGGRYSPRDEELPLRAVRSGSASREYDGSRGRRRPGSRERRERERLRSWDREGESERQRVREREWERQRATVQGDRGDSRGVRYVSSATTAAGGGGAGAGAAGSGLVNGVGGRRYPR